MLLAMFSEAELKAWFFFVVFSLAGGLMLTMKGLRAAGGGNAWRGAKKSYGIGRGLWRLFG